MKIISTSVALTLALTAITGCMPNDPTLPILVMPSPLPTVSIDNSRTRRSPSPTPLPTPTMTTAIPTSMPTSSVQPTSTTTENSTTQNCTPALTMPVQCVPYSTTSPFNRTVAQQSNGVSPNSASEIAYYQSISNNSPWFSLSFGYKNQNNQYQHPIFISTSTSDPSYNVHCTETWDVCPTQYFHSPSYAQPAGGTDHHLAVIDTTENNLEMDCWDTSNLSGHGGTITAGECSSVQESIDKGIGGAATGAGYALWAGVIRAPELANLTPQINHSLFLVAPCTSNLTVYPSNWRASSDTACPNGQGAPYGAWLRLNMTPTQITALHLPLDHQAILLTLANYGGFVGDTNNFSGWSVQVEADPTYSLSSPKYTFQGSGCPGNGAPCTLLTAWEHYWGDPDWASDRYTINLGNDVNWAQNLVVMNPPTQ